MYHKENKEAIIFIIGFSSKEKPERLKMYGQENLKVDKK